MRTITIILTLLALPTTASAVPLDAQVSNPLDGVGAHADVTTSEQDPNGVGDQCAPDRERLVSACVTVSSSARPDIVLYADTGLADGWAGIWQETNGWKGLQKDVFRHAGTTEAGDAPLVP